MSPIPRKMPIQKRVKRVFIVLKISGAFDHIKNILIICTQKNIPSWQNGCFW
jgi:hypothetical protein